MNRYDDQKIKEALASCLSGVEALPSMRADILRAAKGEGKVKRKMNLGLVLVLILVLLSTSVAVAEALGLFGQIGQQEDADVRLPGLEAVATPVGQVFTTEDGVTITINQAYYDGTRVFLSYAVAGPHHTVELGEGQPDVVNYDRQEPGVIYGQAYQDESAIGQQIANWLNGSAPRWAKKTTVWIPDSLEMADGSVLDIIGGGGDNIYQADGSYINWKECEVPADKAAEEITVKLTVCTSENTYYQEADCLFSSYGGIVKRSEFTFTVEKSETTLLTGSSQGDGWVAQAQANISAVDMKGTITVTGVPESWNAWWTTAEAPAANPDPIAEWKLYVSGQPFEGYNLYGSVDPNVPGVLTYGFCYQVDAATEGLMLVPHYRLSGDHPDEAIVLTVKGE